MPKTLRWTINYASIEGRLLAHSITLEVAKQELVAMIKRMPADMQDEELDDIIKDIQEAADVTALSAAVVDLSHWGYAGTNGILVERWHVKTVRMYSGR